jgi:hypothetical protein
MAATVPSWDSVVVVPRALVAALVASSCATGASACGGTTAGDHADASMTADTGVKEAGHEAEVDDAGSGEAEDEAETTDARPESGFFCDHAQLPLTSDACVPAMSPCATACDCCYYPPEGTWCEEGYCTPGHGQ